MARKTAIGIQYFDEIKEKNCFYVDKTYFIRQWWENQDKVTLIARPRRFGKTLNMSMIECFFSYKYRERSDLFQDLFIWKEAEYRKLQGTYPVIFISFAEVKGGDYNFASGIIKQILMDKFRECEKLLLTLSSKEEIAQEHRDFILRGKRGELSEEELVRSLLRISEIFNEVCGKKVIILIDEYDTPLQEAWLNGYWEKITIFFRSFLHSTFKANSYLERGIMTGITRVSKESMFSDLNHLEVVTTTSEKYATVFGFTEKEVIDALKEYKLYEKKDIVKFWYNGFNFGKHSDIYNPWSILHFLDKKKEGSYWVNTSSNALVSNLIRESSDTLKKSFEDLLKGERIYSPIDEQIIYNNLTGNDEAIWSLLVATGYLKVLSHEDEREIAEPVYQLAVTNFETLKMFYTMIKHWFSGEKQNYHGFINALLKGDLQEMNDYMSRLCIQLFSFYDTGKGKTGEETERFYHGFVLGLLVELEKKYLLTSNRESGFGRYDIMLKPKDKNAPAFILEFKVHDSKKEKDMEETVEIALRQIKEKQYITALMAEGIPEKNIHVYGFAFKGKEILIGENQSQGDTDV